MGGVKWHCSLNDPEQMSLSQRQTAPKPFRIKLGHTRRAREGETDWRRKEGGNTNEEGGGNSITKRKRRVRISRREKEELKSDPG